MKEFLDIFGSSFMLSSFSSFLGFYRLAQCAFGKKSDVGDAFHDSLTGSSDTSGVMMMDNATVEFTGRKAAVPSF